MWSAWRTGTAGGDAVALLGLGTNVGDRIRNLQRALRALGAAGRVVATSRVYETEPYGYAEQEPFLNMAVRLHTSLGARTLLAVLKDIEVRLGRIPTHRMGPRVLDIDILMYDDERVDEPGLQIPHPGILERAFVLAPLLDLDAGLRHPVSGELLADRLDAIGRDTVRVVADALEAYDDDA